MYSSVWKRVIVSAVARLARWGVEGERILRWKMWTTYEDVHLGKHVVCGHEFVCDAHPLRLHSVGEAICVRADVGCWEECRFSSRSRKSRENVRS